MLGDLGVPVVLLERNNLMLPNHVFLPRLTAESSLAGQYVFSWFGYTGQDLIRKPLGCAVLKSAEVKSMPLKSFDHVVIPTADPEAILAFYKRLGFTAIREEEWRAGTSRVFSLAFGDNKINVHPPEV